MPADDPPEQPPVLRWANGRGAPPGNGGSPQNGGSPRNGGTAARGPVVTAASAIAAGLEYRGDLPADSPLRLLYLAAAAQATGRLDLATDRGLFALSFRRGVLEQVTSDGAADGLGAYLVRRGAISTEALARAESIKDRFAGDLVSALVSCDAFRPARDLGLLQDHAGVLVTRAIGCERGSAEWIPGAAPGGAGFPLASRWGLVCEAARRLDAAVAARLLGDRAHRAATRSRGRVEASELRLIPQEARAAALFDGLSSAAQLAATRPGEAHTILKVAFLLAETELLQFGALVTAAPAQRAGASRPATPAPAPATAARPAAPAGPPAAASAPARVPTPEGAVGVRAAGPAPAHPAAPSASAPTPPGDDRTALEAFHRKLGSADHFEVLGAKRTATPAQLKSAYFQLAKRYHPDVGAPDEPPPVKKLRVDIFSRIGEAWAVLGSDKERTEYLRELESGRAARDVDVSHILKAEEIFRRATVLARARQYASALATLEQAIGLNPEESEFEVWRAWLRYLTAPDREAQRPGSAGAIAAALEKAPKCVAGYLFLAQMSRNAGDVDGAERHLRCGLAVAPQHEELVRELKLIEQKRK